MEWVKVYYNGLETNIEATKCGMIKRIITDWDNNHFNSKYGIINLELLKKDKDGYLNISVRIKNKKRKILKLHQIIASAFLNYKFDKFNNVVDHIDNNPKNNNLNNLQVISNRENCSRLRTEKSGLPVGVVLHKKTNKYTSFIRNKNKRYYLGIYKTIEEASNAYQNKLKELNNGK